MASKRADQLFTYKARGRAVTDTGNLRRQTDSAAHTVELLEAILQEQQMLRDLVTQALNAAVAAGRIPPPLP